MSEQTTDKPTQAVFERVHARPVSPPDPQHGRLVHLAWSAPEQGDRLVQIYANGELAGTSMSPADREAWLVLDAAAHTQIELLAVTPNDATTPHTDALAGASPPACPAGSFDLTRDAALPIDARLRLTIDDSADALLTPLFPADAARSGFGSVFGEGGFGYDAATGPGLGLGQLGYGPLGTDGDALRWRDRTLGTGDHTLHLALVDAAGRPASEQSDLPLTITRLPDPPAGLALDDDLQLTWT